MAEPIPSKASHHVAQVPSTSVAVLEFLRNSATCKSRIEQIQIELLMAIDALNLIPNSNDESEENAAQSNPLLQSGAQEYEELQLRYRLAREEYKTELWNRDFEPVLQRIGATAAAITNADLEENAKSEAVNRLVASGYVVRKEKAVLEELLGECVRMGAILRDVGHFVGTLSRADERCESWSDDLYGTQENSDTTLTRDQEQQGMPRPNAGLLATSQLNSKDDEGVDFRAYCDHIFTSFQNLHVEINDDSSPTFPNNNRPVPTVPPRLTTYLYAAVIEHIAVTQLRAENVSLSHEMIQERKQFNTTFSEVKHRNEEDLSLAAGLLIETMEVKAQVERVQRAASADLGVSVKICEEVARRRDID